MKNLFKSIMMVAVAAISFTSCSNNFTEEIVTGEKIQFNVSAVNEEVTRSAFGEPSEGKYPTLWSGDEGFALNINGADGKTTKDVTATFSDDKRAVNLSADIEFDSAPETYTLYAIAPATAYVSVQPSGWQVTIPTSQTTGTLSCDPAAQILVGASETKASASEIFDMTFKHAVAYGKMTLKNLALNDATISSVAITSTKNIAGRFYINQATREYSDNSGSMTITVNTTSTENIWFALAPVDVSSTELKIVVNTDKGTFTKTVTMPENRKFELGKISTFNVDMNGIELAGPVKYELLTDANNLKVGDKVVIAAAGSNFAISTTQNTNNRGQAAITKSADKKTISDPGADVEIFTVETGKKSETYAFKATKTAGYIYAANSSSNHMKTKATLDDNGSWTVTVDANGVATIKAQGSYTHNWLRYNTSSGLFSCYGDTSNQADVVIYHMEGGGDVEPTPSITADNISDVSAEGVTNATATFTSENLTEAITVTCDGTVVTAASVAESTITYSVSENTTDAIREGWIKLAANGVEVTITVSQLAPISGETPTPGAGGGTDDFATIEASTYYKTYTTTAGWNCVNCCVLRGGNSNSNPNFIMFGEATTHAICMNGKTSAVGKITSPILEAGCGTLEFNYGIPYGDSKIRFKVEIMQNGAVVKTFTVNKDSATKFAVYSDEKTVNVAGDFQIVFTNLSPSNSTSNKDRTAIWNVAWTGYAN